MNSISSGIYSKKVLDTIERIRAVLHFKSETFFDILQLTEKNYYRCFSEEARLPFTAIESLADHLDLAFEAILSGKIDFTALAAHFFGNPTHLPDRYALKKFSKRRTSIHLINSIEFLFGWKCRENILRKFQVNESIFENPDAPINIRFISDICKEICTFDPRKDTLFKMGQSSVKTNYFSKLGETYRSCNDLRQIYEMTFPELAKAYYDTNTFYRLQALSKYSCAVEVIPNPELLEAFKAKVVGNLGTCEQKRGVFSCLPGYQNLPAAEVRELSCMHKGDRKCLFYINFERAVFFHEQRKLNKSKNIRSGGNLSFIYLN